MPPPAIPHHFMIQFVAFMVALLNPLADFGLFLALTQGRSRAEQKSTQGNIETGRMKESPAVVPLAIPISSGPGVITPLLVASPMPMKPDFLAWWPSSSPVWPWPA